MSRPITIQPNDRVAFVGKTQSGKTHFAGYLALSVRRLIVIDPKGMLSNASRKRRGKYSWELTEWESREARKVRADLDRGEAGRLRVPAPLSGNYEPIFRWAYSLQNVTVYIDEMYGVEDGTRPGRWLNALYTRGAEMGIGVWAATQRPRNVPRVMFSESEWKVLFRLTDPDDRVHMRRIIGPMAEEELKNHAFLLYNDAWDTPVRYPSVVAQTHSRTRSK